MSGLEGYCFVCNRATVLRCQGCLKGGKQDDVPFYCSKDHQLSHWKSGHKNACGKTLSSPPGWTEVTTLGTNHNRPYYVAAHELKPGHTLFTKRPLLTFPKIPDGPDFQVWCNQMGDFAHQVRQSTERKLWTCVGCYEMILYGELMQDPSHGMKMNKCTHCGWPLHSNIMPRQFLSDCQLAHAEECRVLTANCLTWDVMKVEEKEVYYHLALLRAVLLPPKSKQELLNLPIICPQFYPNISSAEKTIHFVRERCKLADRASEEELKKMIIIIFGNLVPPTAMYSLRKKLAFIVYAGGNTGRILSHNCTPNCEVYVDPKTLEGTFKTLRTVKKDEILTISLCVDSYYRAINERLIHFVMMFMEPCECARCKDPTEGGTFLSTIKCPADRKSKNKKECQYLVPVPQTAEARSVSGSTDTFVWRCLCRACPGATKQQDVEKLTGVIRQQIERATASYDYAELKSIILRNSGKSLHPNHSLMYYAYFNIAAVASKEVKNLDIYRDPDFKFNLHSKYLADFDKVMEALKTLQPGRIDRFGSLLFCQTLLEMSKLAEKVSTRGTRPSPQDLDKELATIIKNLKESRIIHKSNPQLEPIDFTREAALQKVYSNHLTSSIKRSMDASEIPHFKLLCDKYCDPNVKLDMEEWELEKRQWIQIPAKDVPKFMEKAANGELDGVHC